MSVLSWGSTRRGREEKKNGKISGARSRMVSLSVETHKLSHTQDFDKFDNHIGAIGCAKRLELIGRDSRWQGSLVSITLDQEVVALLPIFTPRSHHWSDLNFAPSTWFQETLQPRDVMILGNPVDSPSQLFVSRKLPRSVLQSTLLGIMREEGRSVIVFPHYQSSDAELLSETLGGEVIWTASLAHSSFVGLNRETWEGTISKKCREQRLADYRLVKREAVEWAADAWNDGYDVAAHLISEHAQAKGQKDHALLVNRRYEQWAKVDDVDVVVFSARSAGKLLGVVTVLDWRNELLVYEIGLPGVRGPERVAAYVSLASIAPVQYAKARGYSQVRLGYGAESAKRSRGAVVEQSYFGVFRDSTQSGPHA